MAVLGEEERGEDGAEEAGGMEVEGWRRGENDRCAGLVKRQTAGI